MASTISLSTCGAFWGSGIDDKRKNRWHLYPRLPTAAPDPRNLLAPPSPLHHAGRGEGGAGLKRGHSTGICVMGGRRPSDPAELLPGGLQPGRGKGDATVYCTLYAAYCKGPYSPQMVASLKMCVRCHREVCAFFVHCRWERDICGDFHFAPFRPLLEKVNTAKMVQHGAGQLLVELVSTTDPKKDADARNRASAAFRNLLCASVRKARAFFFFKMFSC